MQDKSPGKVHIQEPTDFTANSINPKAFIRAVPKDEPLAPTTRTEKTHRRLLQNEKSSADKLHPFVCEQNATVRSLGMLHIAQNIAARIECANTSCSGEYDAGCPMIQERMMRGPSKDGLNARR